MAATGDVACDGERSVRKEDHSPRGKRAKGEDHSLKETVLEVVRALKSPVHIAALSVAYKNKRGHSMKQGYKGGMLKFIHDVCADDLIVTGEGNDTFVRVATPVNRTMQWLRERVTTCGPILVSMLGRMFREEFGRHFSDECGEGISKFLKRHFEQEFKFEPQKGQARHMI